MPWQTSPQPPSRNPFSKLTLSKSERNMREDAFKDLFQVAADTEDEREELWAYTKLKALWVDTVQVGRGDDLVAGFFEAMVWAAQELYRR
jgi:hypothetical protein